MEHYQKMWLLGLGVFVIIGVMIGFAMMTGHSYYQEQYYNHLPSVIQQEAAKPDAIQHYEDMRDELSVPEETAPENITQPGNFTNLTDFFDIYSNTPTRDQTWNRVIWITVLIFGMWAVQGRRRLFGLRVNFITAFAILSGLALAVVIIIPNSFFWQLAIAFGIYTLGTIFSGGRLI